MKYVFDIQGGCATEFREGLDPVPGVGFEKYVTVESGCVRGSLRRSSLIERLKKHLGPGQHWQDKEKKAYIKGFLLKERDIF